MIAATASENPIFHWFDFPHKLICISFEDLNQMYLKVLILEIGKSVNNLKSNQEDKCLTAAMKYGTDTAIRTASRHWIQKGIEENIKFSL